MELLLVKLTVYTVIVISFVNGQAGDDHGLGNDDEWRRGVVENRGRSIDDGNLKYALNGVSNWQYLEQRRKQLDYEEHRTRNSYVVLAPRILRPGTVYRLTVDILQHPAGDSSSGSPVHVTALFKRPPTPIDAAHATVEQGHMGELLFEIPMNWEPGVYPLEVSGKQGSAVLWRNVTQVHALSDFLSIFMHITRTVFTGDQKVGIKAIMLTTDLKPYQESVSALALDPQGNIVKRWLSKMPRLGVVSLELQLPTLPPEGWWTARVQAGRQVHEKKFLVKHFYEPLYEIFVEMPAYHLTTDDSIGGTLTGSYATDKPILGNATLIYSVKQPYTKTDEEFIEIATQHLYNVDVEEDFSLSIDEVAAKVEDLDGAEIKVDVEFTAHFTMIKSHSHSRTRILRPTVKLSFSGTPPYVFKPGMPFMQYITVMYADGEPLETDRLESSSLSLLAHVTTTHGKQITLPEITIPSLANHYQASHDARDALAAEASSTDESWEEEEQDLNHIDIGHAERFFTLHAQYQEFAQYRKLGIYRFEFPIPANTVALRIDAQYVESAPEDEPSAEGATTLGFSAFERLRATAHESGPHSPQIHLSTSTHDATVGHFAVMHVRRNFHTDRFNYMILSKGLMIYSSSEPTGLSNIITFSITVSASMSPQFTIVVYAMTADAEVIADSLTVPVTSFDTMKIDLNINQHKDHSKKTVEVTTSAEPGSYFSLSCQRIANWVKQHPNAPTHARLVHALNAMEPYPRLIHSVLHQSRDGESGDHLTPLNSASYGSDALQTLQHSALNILTDAVMHYYGKSGLCNSTEGQLECGDGRGSCYQHHEICDGTAHCFNHADELACKQHYDDEFPEGDTDDILALRSDALFRLLRHAFIMDNFDPDDLEWCMQDVWIDHGGATIVELEPFKTAEDWLLEGYALHPEYGLAIIRQPLLYVSDPLFYIHVDGPAMCRRGEQIAIRVFIYNFANIDIQALVTLPASDDYKFVHVEEGGSVDYYKPRVSGGDHQHLIWVPKEGGMTEVAFPLAIMMQSGTLEVTIKAVSQQGKDDESIEIVVKPEGVAVRKHTSLLVDLKNRGLVYEFLDIPVEESPIIPLSIWRRYLFGSPAATLTVSGDVFGPTFEGISVDHMEVFNGRCIRNADGDLFNFAATLWTLHYLREIQQLNVPEAAEAFDYLTSQIAALLRHFNKGGFSMWPYSPPSVWLTARVVNTLLHAVHEDWENYIYVDPGVLQRSVMFLVKHQTHGGGFRENPNVVLPDSKFQDIYRDNGSMALTGLVVSVLERSLRHLQGRARGAATQAALDGKMFLELYLGYERDPYVLALVAYALKVAESTKSAVAVKMLRSIERNSNGMKYWSREKIITHEKKMENNQRAMFKPREPQNWDAHAVEATSYALLVFLMVEGITPYTESIMSWLNAVRDWNSAFISTADTVIAMEALTDYARQARLRDVTEMEVSLAMTSSLEDQFKFHIRNDSLSRFHYDLDRVFGHINLIAKGSGQAVAQLEMSWGVDVTWGIKKPQKSYFDLKVKEKYHQFRNKSVITTTACTRWLAVENASTSHTTLLEVELPTGYNLFQPIADKYVLDIRENGTFPQLRNGWTTDTHVFWQFEYIPSNITQCFSYDLQRWFPTANHTRVRSATIMEIFAPEHFQTVMVNSSTLTDLDICEVCGSYQCPYCPGYSSAVVNFPLIYFVWLPILLRFFGT